jgi:MtN3 and saliva related transmembrane protein
MNIDIIGYIGLGFAAIATIPQIKQILYTKQVRDINIFFFILRLISAILYLIYGILKEEYIMVCSTIMPIFFSSIVIILYITYRNIEIESN